MARLANRRCFSVDSSGSLEVLLGTNALGFVLIWEEKPCDVAEVTGQEFSRVTVLDVAERTLTDTEGLVGNWVSRALGADGRGFSL